MTASRILLVEDDEAIASALARVLDSQGHDVRRLSRGGRAVEAAGEDVGLVILDLGLPDIDGLDVCRKLRAARPELAILMLTARDRELDVVAGLDAGADDYLVKPFRLSVLLARVRAHLRRRAAADPESPAEPLEAADITVDLAARRAWRAGAELELRPKEFDLLALLVGQAGRVVTRERIMRDVWDTDWMGSTRTCSRSGTSSAPSASRRCAASASGSRTHEAPPGARDRGRGRGRGRALRGAARTGPPALLPRRGPPAPAARHDRRDATDRCRRRSVRPRGAAAGERRARRLRPRRPAGRGGPARADELVRETLRSGRPADRAGDGVLIVAVPMLVGQRVSGAVRAQRDDARDTRGAWLLLAGIGAAVVALAALAAVVLGRRLARPLERLAAAARRLGEGSFTTRAPRAGVAEVDAVAEALDATAARLDDLVSRERAFSADASHQLRTPLAALRIELEAIELRGDDSPELAAALAQVERLQSTLETLIDVARDVPRRDATTDVPAILDELEARWRGVLADQGRPLRTTAAADAAHASPRVVAEILDVLVGNAERHGRGAVTIVARATAGSIAVDVADEGPGFAGDPEEAFQRRASAANGGHGIGLALARSLAHAEGGRLAITRAAPEPVVTLWLPGESAADG
jgi:DNA-binding response OmpR family regulator/signal transduction histidine kinase